nr:MAG TPA: hypothetical protein [Caudoviricetes sp.]
MLLWGVLWGNFENCLKHLLATRSLKNQMF